MIDIPASSRSRPGGSLSSATRPWLWRLLLAAVIAVLVPLHYFQSFLPQTSKGFLLPVDRLFDLALAAALLLLSGALGLRGLRWLGLQFDSELQRALFAVAVGAGAIAYATLGLGLLGVLWAPVGGLLLVLAAVYTRDEAGAMADLLRRGLARLRESVGTPSPTLPARGEGAESVPPRAGGLQGGPLFTRTLRSVAAGVPLRSWTTVLAVEMAILVLLSLAQALTPVYRVDEIGYHLAIPAQYVEAHSIFRLPLHHGDGRPFTLEMLYTLALLFRSSIAARLLHFAFAAALGLLIFEQGRRYAGQEAGWFALVVFIALPITPVLASWAYVDFGSAYFGVLAAAAVLRHLEARDRRWLALAGICTGLAMGTKLPGLYFLAILPLLLVLGSLRGWRGQVGALALALALDLALFGFIGSLVASPWYLKSWAWEGHPFAMTFVGGSGAVDPVAAASSLGGSLLGDATRYILLPIDVLINSASYTYGHLPTAFGPLFLVVPFALVTGLPRPLRYLLLVAGLLFALWAWRGGETRYYLPGSALLALVTGTVLSRLRGRLLTPAWPRHALLAVVSIVSLATVYDQLEASLTVRPVDAPPSLTNPLAFIMGLQSEYDYLRLRNPEYDALTYANGNLAAGSMLLSLRSFAGLYYSRWPLIQDNFTEPLWLMPDGQGFRYPVLDRKAGPGRLGQATAATLAQAVGASRCLGVTHLFFSKLVPQGAAVPERVRDGLATQIDGLVALQREGALRAVYTDRYAAILEIMLPPYSCQ